MLIENGLRVGIVALIDQLAALWRSRQLCALVWPWRAEIVARAHRKLAARSRMLLRLWMLHVERAVSRQHVGHLMATGVTLAVIHVLISC